jgi:CRP-like cAMP-binding protein
LPPAHPHAQVLIEDPDLGAAVPEEHQDLAQRVVTAPVRTIPAGSWSQHWPDDPAVFGLLVLDGLIAGRLAIPQRSHLELVGAGDVLRPWVSLAEMASTPSNLDWQVLETVRIAVLDRTFMRSVRPWPEIISVLAERLVLRTRRLSFELAVAGLTGVEERLAVMLWHFADRWGRVTPDGVKLHLPLTHAQLSDVIEASRPTVSSAVASMRRAGVMSGGRNGEWILHGSPPERFLEIREQVALQPS